MTGGALWEYRPPRVHPMLYALALVFAFVLATASLEISLRQADASLYAVYAAPLAATLVLMGILANRPVRILESGIEPGGWWLAPRPKFVAWHALAAVYPVSYDVTGAFVSPFASSDGKVTQTGLGLEFPNGKLVVVRFTPSRFSLTSRKSRGFREAVALVRDLHARMGKRMVPPTAMSEHEKAQLLAEARKPFLPFFAIVFLFASAAPVLWLALRLGLPIEAGLPLSLVAPLGTSLRSYQQSRKRNAILNRIHKAMEAAREQN